MEEVVQMTLKEYVSLNIAYWEVAPTLNLELFDDVEVVKEMSSILQQLRRQTVSLTQDTAQALNVTRKSGDCRDVLSELVLRPLDQGGQYTVQALLNMDIEKADIAISFRRHFMKNTESPCKNMQNHT